MSGTLMLYYNAATVELKNKSLESVNLSKNILEAEIILLLFLKGKKNSPKKSQNLWQKYKVKFQYKEMSTNFAFLCLRRKLHTLRKDIHIY